MADNLFSTLGYAKNRAVTKEGKQLERVLGPGVVPDTTATFSKRLGGFPWKARPRKSLGLQTSGELPQICGRQTKYPSKSPFSKGLYWSEEDHPRDEMIYLTAAMEPPCLAMEILVPAVVVK